MKTRPHIVMSSTALAACLGTEPDILRQKLLAGERGLQFGHRFQDRVNCPLGEIPWPELDVRISDPNDSDQLMLDGSHRIFEKLNDASRLWERHSPERIGLFVGTTTSGIGGFFAATRQMSLTQSSVEKLLSPSMQQAWISRKLCERWDIRGPVYTFSSSCVASSQALIMAHDALRMDWVDAAIVLGVDILNPVTIFGFQAMQLLDGKLCEPFTDARAGINLSEAIVAVLLEKGQVGDGHTRILGHAALSEGHHMTQPAPEGVWMRACMERALHNAEVQPDQISYVNPHGTGTLANDEAEIAALCAVFGPRENWDRRVTASKRFTGHSLGASGLLEVAICDQMLRAQENKIYADPNARYALKNSFGFGGANLSLVLQRGEA